MGGGVDVKVIIYEPTIKEPFFENFQIENNIEDFKKKSDIILANRMSEELSDCKEKIYTRDLFNQD